MSFSAPASMVVMADEGCGAQWPHRGTYHLLSLGVPFLFSLEDPPICVSRYGIKKEENHCSRHSQTIRRPPIDPEDCA